MRAVIYRGSTDLSLEDIPVPGLKSGHLLVRLRAAGICGSDINYIKGKFQYSKVPIIPGHEGAGVVEIAGDSGKFEEGDRVVIDYVSSCGRCGYCRSGKNNLCDNLELIGFDRDGTWSEYIAVPEDSLVRLPKNLSFEEGAISGCALVTPFHAIKISGLSHGESLAIIGLGGVGMNAIPIARAMGASKIIGLDIDASKFEIARRYGADILINPLEIDPVEAIKGEMGGVDVAFEFVGTIDTVMQALEITRKGGRVVLVGLTKGHLSLPLPELLFNEKTIITSIDHTRGDLEELLKLIEEGKIMFSSSVSSIIKLNDTLGLVSKMLSGEYRGLRAVIRF